jgi:predicted RNase H-like HicB family nuclease
MDRKYLIVIEKARDGSYSAYVPDLPGCVSCGDTVAEVKRNIKEAVDLYVEDLAAEGQPIPEPTTQAAEMAVGA